jgi:predicted nucleic acid-binding protein
VALVVDTGPLVAALDADDERHEPCAGLLCGADERLVIPAPVLPEVDYLFRARRVPEGFIVLIDDLLRGAYVVEDLVLEDYERVRELLETYADLRVGFVDAAVLAIVERLGERKLATLDHRHFGAMRPRHVDALTLLPA